MRINIIVVGKTRTSHWREAENEYLKRLGQFCDVEMVVLKERSGHTGQSAQAVSKQEGEEILGKISQGDFVVALDERGKEFDSEEFAGELGKWKELGKFLVLVVGGTYGLSGEVRERADKVIALSQMTFTHEMVRPFLLEQLYRGYTILEGKPYHY